MEFDSTKVYYTHISKPKFSDLDDEDMKSILMDGRYVSPFLERFVKNKFSNLEKLGSDAKGKDYIYKDGSKKPLELRGFPIGSNKPQINLYPSYMIGAGRSYNESEYLNNLNNISGHIIVYQATWLDYIIFHIPSSITINNNDPIKYLKRKDVAGYLGRNPNVFLEDKSIQKDQLYEFDVI